MTSVGTWACDTTSPAGDAAFMTPSMTGTASDGAWGCDPFARSPGLTMS